MVRRVAKHQEGGLMRLFLAVLLLSSSQLATQMVLPAMPDIAGYFQISQADTQQIIMLYFVSFGISQLFCGPWVDAFGTRKIFYVGLMLFLLGSVLCFSATTPEMLASGRILQGLGSGSPFILSRVILSNSMPSLKLKKALGSLAIAASVTSIAAPFIGGLLTTSFSWQAVFILFSLHLVVALAFGAKLLPEETQRPRSVSLTSAARDYAQLITDRRFIGAGLFKWLPTLMFMSLGTFLPFEMQRRFGLTAEQYGSLMTFAVFGLLVGSTTARILLKYLASETIIALFWPLSLVAAIILMFYPPGVMATLVAVSCFMILSGTYYAASIQLIMEPFKAKSGTASALVGAIDMCIFSLIAALVNRFWVTDLVSLGELFLACSILIAMAYLLLRGAEVSCDMLIDSSKS